MDYALLIIMALMMLAAFVEIYRSASSQKEIKYGFYIAITGIWLGIVGITYIKDVDHTGTLFLMSLFLCQSLWFYKKKV